MGGSPIKNRYTTNRTISRVTDDGDSQGGSRVSRLTRSANLDWSESVLIPTNIKLRFRDEDIYLQSDADGYLVITADIQTKIGTPGEIILGDSTERAIKPQTDLKVNLGTSALRFKDMYLGGTGYKRIGTSTDYCHVGGTITQSTTTSATSGTGETTLYTYTLPANALANDGDSIELHAWGTTTTSTSDKTLRTYFGAALTQYNLINDPSTFHVHYRIYRESATTQRGFGSIAVDDGTQTFLETATETLSGSLVIKVTATAPTSGTVSGRGFHIIYHPA